jgi:hypothetical protein
MHTEIGRYIYVESVFRGVRTDCAVDHGIKAHESTVSKYLSLSLSLSL